MVHGFVHVFGSITVARYSSINFRLTSQLTKRNKVTVYYDTQTRDQPYFGVSATRTPEASTHLSYPILDVTQGRWMAPVTSRLLLEDLDCDFDWLGVPGAAEAPVPAAAE